MSFVDAERDKMLALMATLGPDAPTLCEGWVTRDLARHNLVRQQPWRAWSSLSYEQMLSALKPLPWDRAVNTIEYFVHHEDVRRANGYPPRELSRAAEDELYSRLRVMAPVLLRKKRPVVLATASRPPIIVGNRGVAEQGDAATRVVGPVGELVLWAFGRQAVVT